MLEEEKQQIRNADGKLLCELSYDGESWRVCIKRGERLTHLFLYPSGNFHVANDGEDTGVRTFIEVA